MKPMHTALLGSFLAVLTFSGCKKDDKPTAKECQVQQFESTRSIYMNGVTQPVPYLFSKTFDANGDVNTIDAYTYSMSGAFRQQGKLERKNQMVYILSTVGTDTIMILSLNSTGKVIKAEEKSGIKKSLSSESYSYEFIYNASNKLQQYKVRAVYQANPPLEQTFTLDVLYDAAGNCTEAGYAYFTYDLTRTAKKQFYFDAETLTNPWLGFRLLEYLNYFPEITSPLNIRTNTKAVAAPSYVLANVALTDHQLDADGKLISYKVGGTQTIPIFWSCGNNIKQ